MAAHQSKIWRFSVYAYTCARHAHRNTLEGLHPWAFGGTPGRGWRPSHPQRFPNSHICLQILITLAATSDLISFVCFGPSHLRHWSSSNLLQLIFLGDSNHHLNCIEPLKTLFYLKYTGLGSHTQPCTCRVPLSHCSLIALQHTFWCPRHESTLWVFTFFGCFLKCRRFALSIFNWFLTGLLSFLRQIFHFSKKNVFLVLIKLSYLSA